MTETLPQVSDAMPLLGTSGSHQSLLQLATPVRLMRHLDVQYIFKDEYDFELIPMKMKCSLVNNSNNRKQDHELNWIAEREHFTKL